MALPPQAIEKLIREPSHTQGAYRELLLISGAMLGIAVVIYVGLAFGYRAYLNSSLDNVEEQIAKFSAGISQEDRAQIQGFYSQLVNLRTLLAGHTVASPVMALLERTVQPDVYYSKLTMNANNNQAVLAGAARSLAAAAAQAAALQGQPEVDRVDFNNAGLQSAGPWQFTMTIYLKPEVFHGVIVKAPEAPAVPAAPAATSTPVSTSTPR
jgi:Tfp pilus assembly protein PilN